MSGPWLGLFLALLLIAAAIKPLPGEGTFRGFSIPTWGLVVELFIGLFLGCISIRAILRGEGKKKSPTDEDIQKAKETLERIHLREYGTLPDYPDERKGNDSGDGDDKKKM